MTAGTASRYCAIPSLARAVPVEIAQRAASPQVHYDEQADDHRRQAHPGIHEREQQPLALAWIDADFQLLPDAITLPGIAIGLGLSFWSLERTPGRRNFRNDPVRSGRRTTLERGGAIHGSQRLFW
jgi:hypothetical protein